MGQNPTSAEGRSEDDGGTKEVMGVLFVLPAKFVCHCLDLVALPVIACNLEIGFSFCNSKIQLKIKLPLIRNDLNKLRDCNG